MRRILTMMAVLATFAATLVAVGADNPPAAAVEPDPRPLPECGPETYTCQPTSTAVSASVGGEVSEDGTVTVELVPSVPACNQNVGPVPGGWENAPCYSSVGFAVPSLCLTIDTFDDDTVRTGSCSSLLYEDGSFTSFSFASEDGRNHDTVEPYAVCGLTSAFGVYVEGGPSNRPLGPWAAKGPTALDCRMTFTGDRPNGLYGPTWMWFSGSLGVRDNGLGSVNSGGNESAGQWVYVRGDLRDGLVADIDAERQSITGSEVSYTFDASDSIASSDDPITSYEWVITGGDSTITRTTAQPELDFTFAQADDDQVERTVTLTVRTASGLTDDDDVTVSIPAVVNIGSVDFTAAPTRAPDADRPPPATEVSLDFFGIDHDVTSEVGDYTISLEWLASLDGGSGRSLLSPTETLRSSDGPFASDEALDVFYSWAPPRFAGRYYVRATVELMTTEGTYGRAERVLGPLDVVGADVVAEVEEGVRDAEDPGLGVVGETFTFDLTLRNTGFDWARIETVELRNPVEGVDVEFDAVEDLLLFDDTDRVIPVTLSSTVPGVAEIPFVVTYEDYNVGPTSRGTVEVSAHVNLLGDLEWTVPDRIERPADGEIPDLPDTSGETDDVQHESYPVDVTLLAGDCDADLDWTANGESIDDPVPTPDRTDECQFRFEFEEEDDYLLEARADGVGEPVVRGTVTVEDVLWVVVGDSVASGEGNPDIGPSAPGGAGSWIDERCHRSANAGAVQAAYDYEEEYDQSSVTLIHVACSGATVDGGLNGPQPAVPMFGTPAAPHQMDIVQDLIGDREIDALVVHIGGNDVLFGPAAKFCFANGGEEDPCSAIGFSPVTNFQSANTTVINDIPVPESLTPFTGAVCRDAAAGTREVNVSGDGDISADTFAGWEIYLNFNDDDFSDRRPLDRDISAPTPTDGEEGPYDVLDFSPRLCPGDWASRLAGSSGAVSAQFSFDEPLEDNHYSGYLPQSPNPFEAGPLTEAVVAFPPSLDDAVAEARNDFDASLAAFNTRLQLMGDSIDPQNVFMVEYYNPTRNSAGATCEEMMTIPLTGLGINEAEVAWSESAVLDPLNTTVAATNARFGWTVVGGVASAFTTHGYCADDSWIVTLSDDSGAGTAGVLHPNGSGHQAIAEKIFDAVDGVVEDPSEIRGSDPTAADRLAEAARKGDNVLRFAPDDQLTTAALADGELADLAVGDWLLVGSGNDATADHAFPLAPPQLVEVVAISGSTVTIAPALAATHGRGTVVSRVPAMHRDDVEDPWDGDGTLTAAFACDASIAVPFTDLPGAAWADDAIRCVYDIGVTTGTTPTTFSPRGEVTRVQMAAFMQRLYERMTATDCPIVDTPFTDLPGSAWGDEAIACLYGLGVTTGTSPTTYTPAAPVSRAQMAAFIARLWNAVRGQEADIAPTPFDDLPAQAWAADAIGRIYGLGITTGTSPTTYSPGATVTRMQMAAFLVRFYEAPPP